MNEGKFIYVFSTAARDRLIKAGYTLLKSDEINNAYIFENNPKIVFSFNGIGELKTNTLTF